VSCDEGPLAENRQSPTAVRADHGFRTPNVSYLTDSVGITPTQPSGLQRVSGRLHVQPILTWPNRLMQARCATIGSADKTAFPDAYTRAGSPAPRPPGWLRGRIFLQTLEASALRVDVLNPSASGLSPFEDRWGPRCVRG